MAEVYLAEQISLRRNVAIKVLLPELAKDEAYVRRFNREAQSAAALTHSNIVQIYEVGKSDGFNYIAQEYVPGQNLKQLLSKQGTLEIGLVFMILRQVAAALFKAAEHGIVHRDIKPENILINGQGEVKVADFGLARVTAERDDAMNLTQVGVTMGTPLYMSPEQAEGKSLDTRSDIYSLGVTAYHLLAGRPPFEGDTPLTVAVKHLNTEPERLEKIRSGVPAGFSRIVHKMLAKKPADRQQDATELLRELRDLQSKLGETVLGSDASDWSIAEMSSLSSIRSDNLRALSNVMKTSANSVYRRPNRARQAIYGIAVAIACCVIGGGLAVASRKPGLLLITPEQRAEMIPEWENAKEQFDFAMFKNLEREQRPEFFAAVPKYFPVDQSEENLVWGLKAMKQQAVILLAQSKSQEALRVFHQLSEQPEIQAEARAFGLAGKSICFFQLGRIGESEQFASLASTQEYMKILEESDKRFFEEFNRIREILKGQTQN